MRRSTSAKRPRRRSARGMEGAGVASPRRGSASIAAGAVIVFQRRRCRPGPARARATASMGGCHQPHLRAARSGGPRRCLHHRRAEAHPPAAHGEAPLPLAACAGTLGAPSEKGATVPPLAVSEFIRTVSIVLVVTPFILLWGAAVIDIMRHHYSGWT